MSWSSVLVQVPATVGNLAGAGDCAALALDASLNVKVTPRFDGEVGIRYFGHNGERVPRSRANHVAQAMEAALRRRGYDFTGADLEIYSSVPVRVGLGSTTAAVAAGVLAADRLFGLGLEETTLLELAGAHGSRRDNVHAAWYGGLAVCVEDGGSRVYRRTLIPEDILLTVVVPEVEVREDAEPARLDRRDRSAQMQRAAALTEAITQPGSGNFTSLPVPSASAAGKAVPGLEEALQVHRPEVLSVFVCGAGPAVGILTRGHAAEAAEAVRACLASHGVVSAVTECRPSNSGARDWNAVRPEISLPAVAGLRPAVA
jgi:homoserine kinase